MSILRFIRAVSEKSKAFVAVFLSLSLAQLVTALVFFAELLPVTVLLKDGHLNIPLKSFWISAALAAFTDTTLALALVVLLRRRRAQTPFTRTSTMIQRLMVYTIGTGLATAAFAFCGFVTSLAMRDNLVFVVFVEIAPKSESIFTLKSYC